MTTEQNARGGQPVYLYAIGQPVRLRPEAREAARIGREAAGRMTDDPPALDGVMHITRHGVPIARGLRCLAGHDMGIDCPGPLYGLGLDVNDRGGYLFILAEHDLEPVLAPMPRAADIAIDVVPDLGPH